MSTALKLEHIHKTYIDEQGAPSIEVLRDISFEVEPGQSIAVTGPSGCGKSTLLNIAGALDTPTSGIVSIAGNTLTDTSPDALASIRNRNIGFVFQLHHLLPQCSVLENILLPTIPNNQPDDGLEHAKQLIERVGLQARTNQRPATLSGGERQRVAVVRALINRPQLLLADEPTGSLDGESAESLVDLLVELNAEEGLALVMVTHNTTIAKRMQTHYDLRHGTLTRSP
ncbi:MAG: ABC transporter ATP-binding protein [Verrucomicrobia bacterium]|jgi:lipoprotein-releasing system ATP-binding protein|nr:ABC transporter ATP-binding protein [Verrucomicrobiota bacterium]